MERSTVLYDGACSFCRWSVDALLRLDRRGRLRAVPIQSAEGAHLLERVAPEERLASWHLRLPSGEVVSAGAAVAPLLRLLPWGGSFAALAARFPAATERVYGWVARNRGWLGRLLQPVARRPGPAPRR